MIFAQFLFDLFILVIIFLKRENILIPSYESVRIMNNMQFIGLEIFFFCFVSAGCVSRSELGLPDSWDRVDG